jgi:hypothetical protein
MLDCLATQIGSPVVDTEKLLERLTALRVPRAPVVLVSPRSTRLGPALSARLHRRVLTLDVSTGDGQDFYERPSNHEA